jgi:hypothetical protein
MKRMRRAASGASNEVSEGKLLFQISEKRYLGSIFVEHLLLFLLLPFLLVRFYNIEWGHKRCTHRLSFLPWFVVRSD